MNKEGNQESDFASDHFFVHANLTYLEKEDKGLKDGSFLVMSANLDQGHQNDSYYHNKVKKQFYKVMLVDGYAVLSRLSEQGPAALSAQKPVRILRPLF